LVVVVVFFLCLKSGMSSKKLRKFVFILSPARLPVVARWAFSLWR
jgi:hypothetical protein